MLDDRGRPPPSGDTGQLRLTYSEIAARLGISPDAARQLVRRRGWRRIMPNRKGAPATVLVPQDELSAEQWRQDRPTPQVDPPTPGDADRSSAVEVLQLAFDREHERADRAEKRADAADTDRRAAEARADRETARADRAEQGREDERARGDALRDRVEALQAQLVQLEAEGAVSDVHAAELTAQLRQVRAEALEVSQAAEALRQADAERRGRGRLVRAWRAWRGV
jgi:hypothetical protein